MARTVVTKTRRSGDRGIQEFSFDREMIPSDVGSPEFMKKYREKAWQDFRNLWRISSTEEWQDW
jgi:hypothetical protein